MKGLNIIKLETAVCICHLVMQVLQKFTFKSLNILHVKKAKSYPKREG